MTPTAPAYDAYADWYEDYLSRPGVAGYTWPKTPETVGIIGTRELAMAPTGRTRPTPGARPACGPGSAPGTYRSPTCSTG